MGKSIKITTKALIHRGNEVLLMKDRKGKWEMPGGKLEFGESPEDSLVRELKEELSVRNPLVKKLVDVWVFSIERVERNIHYVFVVYEVILRHHSLKKSKEHVAFEWFGKNKIKNLKMREGYKNSINKFFKNKLVDYEKA
ncbi:MAG: hypothetical protein A3I29_00180 [Candidatus Magasanikbacteria bacterium RIFCSPLOWO2_02_FULL_44_11]|uniref:Nudix hydrolase domain-containing protein n=2 Tax=Candidatus Magasanikiibacteriota TaxID=1752731 RepID=A0A1F6NAV2_9BACT|nr:MAG: hypothetical protein A3D53_01950 [Candidatus Magasanikbacteria bacterium RIFCSPHIGHO2_02_FULL_45_10]OGH80981.1 MAG: hypothetical protein A3I29_00180 [Candidatus Magasanikbacteria bacterium RIFCSPLOWO2_02_FULL_44_11]